MKTTCIMCPIGCQLEITKDENGVSVVGNLCPRGKQYGVDEATCPKRIVTSIVKCSKDLYCSVKTTCPVEKSKIKDVLHEIALIPPRNYQFGEILIKNVAGTDADIVVTGV